MTTYEELQATDRALDAIARGEQVDVTDPAYDALFALRATLDDELAATPPTAELPVVVATRRRGRGWKRTAVAGVATVVALASAGGVAAALTARPGSALYPLHKALLGPEDRTAEVGRLIERAGTAFSAGDFGEAGRLLRQARAALPEVPDPIQRATYAGHIDALSALLSASPSPAPSASDDDHDGRDDDDVSESPDPDDSADTDDGSGRGRGRGGDEPDPDDTPTPDETDDPDDNSGSGSDNSGSGSDSSGSGSGDD